MTERTVSRTLKSQKTVISIIISSHNIPMTDNKPTNDTIVVITELRY